MAQEVHKVQLEKYCSILFQPAILMWYSAAQVHPKVIIQYFNIADGLGDKFLDMWQLLSNLIDGMIIDMLQDFAKPDVRIDSIQFEGA